MLPAYQAVRTLAATIAELDLRLVTLLIIVDDASRDGTYEEAERLVREHSNLTDWQNSAAHTDAVPTVVIRLTQHRGYGGNQKVCYARALAAEIDIVVMLHPDNQYAPGYLPQLIKPLVEGRADVVLGSRMHSRERARAGGMPLYKYYVNRLLGTFQNMMTKRRIADWHTGYRAYTRHALAAVPYENFSDGFVFDTQMLLTLVKHDRKIGEVNIETRYFPEASSIGLVEGLLYAVQTVYETLRYACERPHPVRK